uniref:Odontosis associated phosphoprotein n=1 Tax=Monodelphis domestica TaxID=13616 RepID=A0A5F8GHW2_MONDO
MAGSPSPVCFSYRLLVFWLLVTVAKGQGNRYTPPGGSGANVNPTDCQIFTLTPPPATRRPVTAFKPVTIATRRCYFPHFRKPRVHFDSNPPFRYPNYGPHGHLPPPHPPFQPHLPRKHCYHPFALPRRGAHHYKYFPRRKSSRDSSSEEYRRKREVPALLKQI